MKMSAQGDDGRVRDKKRPSPAVNMPSGEPGETRSVSKVVKADSTDGQTARSELLILCHEPPERCSVPRCACCHCKWDDSGLR